MSASNLFPKEEKRKLSDGKESLGNNSKTMNEDIKPNVDIILKNIKKEPDFMLGNIKKETDFEVREIKKEPCQSDTELVTPYLTVPTKSNSREQKTTKANKRARVTAKAKKKTSKKQNKSTQTEKSKSKKKSATSKKPKRRSKTKTKRKSRKKIISANKSAKSKKEANTLLDRQNNGDLHLFGFKDELEYFSLESDHKELKETIPEGNISGKRTSLSSLNAREKVIHALKSTTTYPSSNSKPVIQHSKGENIDLLGSILESQTLWHSKTSHMKVNEDGSVEVIDRRNKKLVEIEATMDKESNLLRNKTNSTIPPQARSDPAHTTLLESLNENTETSLTKMNIKTEACETQTSDAEMVFDENKAQTCIKKIKLEGKKEEMDLPRALPSVSFVKESSSPVPESAFDNSIKTEKSDDEADDCPIFSIYSKASKIFSLQRDKERQMRFISNESEIQVIRIIKGKENPSKRNKNYRGKVKVEELDKAKEGGRSPSPKRKRKENKKIECIIVE